MERWKGTSLHLPLHWTQSHSLTSHGPPAAKPWHRGASQDHSWLMVMLNGWPNLELLPFLLSTPLTSLSFFPMRSLVWGTCPWNQTALLCLFFSASFYYRLFLPNTLKGAGAECTCEVVGTEKCDKALRMSSFWIYSISRSFYLIMPKTKKKEWNSVHSSLCHPGNALLTSLLGAWIDGQFSKTVPEQNRNAKVQFSNVEFPLQDLRLIRAPAHGGSTERVTC